MPALAATRSNPDLRAKYRQLVAEGKPRKVAVVGVMRKLLVLANALLDQDRCWLPERPGRDSAPLERFSDSLGSDWARDERRERRGEVRRERVVDTAIECL